MDPATVNLNNYAFLMSLDEPEAVQKLMVTPEGLLQPDDRMFGQGLRRYWEGTSRHDIVQPITDALLWAKQDGALPEELQKTVHTTCEYLSRVYPTGMSEALDSFKEIATKQAESHLEQPLPPYPPRAIVMETEAVSSADSVSSIDTPVFQEEPAFEDKECDYYGCTNVGPALRRWFARFFRRRSKRMV